MTVLTEARAQYGHINMAKSPSLEVLDKVHIDALDSAQRTYLYGPTQQEVYESLRKFEQFKMELNCKGLLGKLGMWFEIYLGGLDIRAQHEVGKQIVIRRKLQRLHQTPTFRSPD